MSKYNQVESAIKTAIQKSDLKIPTDPKYKPITHFDTISFAPGAEVKSFNVFLNPEKGGTLQNFAHSAGNTSIFIYEHIYITHSFEFAPQGMGGSASAANTTRQKLIYQQNFEAISRLVFSIGDTDIYSDTLHPYLSSRIERSGESYVSVEKPSHGLELPLPIVLPHGEDIKARVVVPSGFNLIAADADRTPRFIGSDGANGLNYTFRIEARGYSVQPTR